MDMEKAISAMKKIDDSMNYKFIGDYGETLDGREKTENLLFDAYDEDNVYIGRLAVRSLKRKPSPKTLLQTAADREIFDISFWNFDVEFVPEIENKETYVSNRTLPDERYLVDYFYGKPQRIDMINPQSRRIMF